jgi:hypothetical protein
MIFPELLHQGSGNWETDKSELLLGVSIKSPPRDLVSPRAAKGTAVRPPDPILTAGTALSSFLSVAR